MRVTVLSLSDPWEASHGGTIRTRALTTACAELGHDVVAVFPVTAGSRPNVTDRTPPGARGSVITSPVGGSTIGQGPWPSWAKRIKRALLPLPTAFGGRSAAISDALRALGDTDLLLVSVLPFARYAEDVPGARLWVDHSDLYSDVVAREADRRPPPWRWTARLQQRAVERAEGALARTAAATSTAGYADAQTLARRTGKAAVWLPTPVTSGRATRNAAARPVAGLFANFHYWPNMDAFDLLCDVWAPRISASGWDVVVAGLGSDQLPRTEGVEVLGPVATPADFYRRVDVTLAPVRVGGGMKVKVVESLAHGRPVVATRFALAGFPETVAVLTHMVDPDDPDLSLLTTEIPPVPAAAKDALRPFTAEGFRATVEDLLATVGAPVTP